MSFLFPTFDLRPQTFDPAPMTLLRHPAIAPARPAIEDYKNFFRFPLQTSDFGLQTPLQ